MSKKKNNESSSSKKQSTKQKSKTAAIAKSSSSQDIAAQLLGDDALSQHPEIADMLNVNPLSQFSLDEDELRLSLVTTQYALRETRQAARDGQTNIQPTGLLVLVNGMELAGKGQAVKQLRQWVDPRLLKVEATIGYPAMPSQPLWQPHTKALPRHGDVMVYFGNWYADLIYEVMQRLALTKAQTKGKNSGKNKSSKSASVSKTVDQDWRGFLQTQLLRLATFERYLNANDTKVLKCWFHIDNDTLKARLNDKEADPSQLYQMDWSDESVLEEFNDVAKQILGQQGDWVVIDGTDKEQATLTFCHQVLNAMQTAVNNSQRNQGKDPYKRPKPQFIWADIPDKLTDVDDADMNKSAYKDELTQKQAQLAKLLRARGDRHVVFAFEGMDAAGKGGAIKRLVALLDPREYQIYNIGAPMQFELEHPYLWRFWTRLPNPQTDRISRIAIFDRTWYGRVLVERIEGFAREEEWHRAFDEINNFEDDLTASGVILIKYWLAIDKQEQLQRFEDRQDTPYKQFKLTDDDWRNRDHWQDYVQAASDMLARTNSASAPWCMVATNDKRTARIMVLDHAIAQLTKALNLSYEKSSF